jgi:nitrogen fixation protein FixH
MLESLLALPLGAAAEVGLFVLLYLMTPLNARQAGALTFLALLAVLLVYSLLQWPGADVLALYVAVLAVTAYLLAMIGNMRAARLARGHSGGRWFHWAPAVIVMFFVALFALDAVLVVISKQGLPAPVASVLMPATAQREQVRSVFPGTVANDFQKKESLYNEYLQQVQAQQLRGWQVRKGWLQPPLAGQPAEFQVQVSEADGAPVQYAEVSGQFQRPSDSRLDQDFVMQAVQPGLYRVEISLPEPGIWVLVLKVRRGEQLHEVHASTSIGAARSAAPGTQ